jgi:hypothetical protein
MSISSRLLGWLFRLPPPETRDVTVHRDLKVPMPDGVTLLADRYEPKTGDHRPVILVRSPYGRAGVWGMLFGRPLAERGFQVVIQSCRGTFGSGGDFAPFRNERADGLATVEWLKKQPWFPGTFATFGPSYLGFVQWAIASEAGPELKAMSAQVTSSEFRSPTYEGETFWLDTALFWCLLVSEQERPMPLPMFTQMKAPRVLRRSAGVLPLSEADRATVGRTAPFIQEWLAHNEPGDEYWKAIDHSAGVSRTTAEVTMLGGWYDCFLPYTLEDYARLRKAGKRPHLSIGPWTHTDERWFTVGLGDAIAFFRAHLLGDRSLLRESPVRLYVMGANEWREFADWPPPGARPQRWYLHAHGGLSTELPGKSEPDRYRYDPADPTPGVGGGSLSKNSGPKDNRELESRRDVLVFTSEAMTSDLDVIGPVSVEVYVKSSLEHTDFFAKLCDVDPSGKSINLCDGIVRLRPGSVAAEADGSKKVVIRLWATANRFKRGHRIRVHVSSGAHPRYARNLGTGEPLATGTKMLAAEQTVYHDPEHPSAIVLSVLPR